MSSKRWLIVFHVQFLEKKVLGFVGHVALSNGLFSITQYEECISTTSSVRKPTGDVVPYY